MDKKHQTENEFNAFVDSIGRDLYLPDVRFMHAALYGVLMSRSTMLSQIGRELDRDSTFKSTEMWLSRRFSSMRFRDTDVRKSYLTHTAAPILEELPEGPVIAVDLTDISKPRARLTPKEPGGRHMPLIAKVRDASKDVISNGWSVIAAEATFPDGRLPLHSSLFSHADPLYRSLTHEVQKTLDLVQPHVPNDSLWIFDRGFESRQVLKILDASGIDYAMRLALPDAKKKARQRNVWIGEDKQALSEAIPSIVPTHTFLLDKGSASKTKDIWRAHVGFRTGVRLQAYTSSGHAKGPSDQTYSLICIRRSSKDGQNFTPMVVLTNVKVTSEKVLRKIVNAYFSRWSIEERFRFVKCHRLGFDMEDVRVMSWVGLQRMTLFVMLSYAFVAVLMCREKKLTRSLCAQAQAFGSPPTYQAYRVAQGLRRVFRNSREVKSLRA